MGRSGRGHSAAVAAAGAACLASSVLEGAEGIYLRSDNRAEYVTSPRMHEIYKRSDLPRELDWRAKDGKNYTTVTRNQHIPMYCGACYSFGSTSALSDRIRIARGGVGREINVAMQVVLNCDREDLGCSGGDALSVYRWIKEYSIPDETCQPYESRGHDTGNTCYHKDVCRRCDEHSCRAQADYEVYGIDQLGTVKGEYELMAELQRGPVACAIATPDDFINLSGWDIYEDKTYSTAIDHIISIVGYGTDNGKDYWLLRNSWGTYWGYYGWARVARGNNTLMIETDCAWATPSNDGQPTWRHVNLSEPEPSAIRHSKKAPHFLAASTVDGDAAAAAAAAEEEEAERRRRRREEAREYEEKEQKENERFFEDEPPSTPCRVAKTDWAAAGGERVLTPRPHETLEPRDVPESFDWRNVSGRSYATWNTNEHVPHGRCASCWAQAVTSALADRIAVVRKGAWPQIGLSPQVLLNCRAGGSCKGGDTAKAYAYIARYGITDETCQNYQAEEFECEGKYICRNCAPGGEHGLVWPGTCVAVDKPIVWSISEYGAVRGAWPMKAEIFQRGPITCGLQSTKGFRRYRGGIYEESLESEPRPTHQVSLTGWGRGPSENVGEKGKEFWEGRNSWGTYWGEGGWFKLRMHENNLGVETDCDWAIPLPETEHPVPSTMLSSMPRAEDAAASASSSSSLDLAAAVAATPATRPERPGAEGALGALSSALLAATVFAALTASFAAAASSTSLAARAREWVAATSAAAALDRRAAGSDEDPATPYILVE